MVATVATAVAAALVAPSASAAPTDILSSLLTREELPARYGRFEFRALPTHIDAPQSATSSAQCDAATARAAAATQGMASNTASASLGESSMLVAVISKPVARELADMLRHCEGPSISEYGFLRLATPSDLKPFSPHLFVNAGSRERRAFVDVNSVGVYVAAMNTSPEDFWSALRRQIEKTRTHH